MAIIFLVRHGQNGMVGKKLVGRLPGVHLNEQGQAQARCLAEKFSQLPLKAIYASPLERAQETAAPIAGVHNLPVEIHPGLLEIDFGGWQGKRLKRLKQGRLWKAVQGSPAEFRFPNGESFLEAQQRMTAALFALDEKCGENDMVVCVSHSDMIRLAVAHFLGLPLDHFQRLRIETASVTLLNLHAGKASFGPINLTFDFPEEMY